jgi:hypothetical protein
MTDEEELMLRQDALAWRPSPRFQREFEMSRGAPLSDAASMMSFQISPESVAVIVPVSQLHLLEQSPHLEHKHRNNAGPASTVASLRKRMHEFNERAVTAHRYPDPARLPVGPSAPVMRQRVLDELCAREQMRPAGLPRLPLPSSTQNSVLLRERQQTLDAGSGYVRHSRLAVKREISRELKRQKQLQSDLHRAISGPAIRERISQLCKREESLKKRRDWKRLHQCMVKSSKTHELVAMDNSKLPHKDKLSKLSLRTESSRQTMLDLVEGIRELRDERRRRTEFPLNLSKSSSSVTSCFDKSNCSNASSSPSLISTSRKRSRTAADHVASSATNMNKKARSEKCIAPTQKIDQVGSVASVMSIDRSCDGAAPPSPSRSSIIAHAMVTGGSSRSIHKASSRSMSRRIGANGRNSRAAPSSPSTKTVNLTARSRVSSRGQEEVASPVATGKTRDSKGDVSVSSTISNAGEHAVIASGQTSSLCIDSPSASVGRQSSSNSTSTVGEDCVNSMKLLALAQIASARIDCRESVTGSKKNACIDRRAG